MEGLLVGDWELRVGRGRLEACGEGDSGDGVRGDDLLCGGWRSWTRSNVEGSEQCKSTILYISIVFVRCI